MDHGRRGRHRWPVGVPVSVHDRVDLNKEGRTMAVKAPCYGCADRTVGCHGQCAKYAEWSAEKRLEAEQRQQESVMYLKTDDYRRNIRRKLLNKARYGH